MRPTVVYPPVYLATNSSSNCSALSARFVPQLALVPRAAAVVRLPPSSLNRPTGSRSWVDISAGSSLLSANPSLLATRSALLAPLPECSALLLPYPSPFEMFRDLARNVKPSVRQGKTQIFWAKLIAAELYREVAPAGMS